MKWLQVKACHNCRLCIYYQCKARCLSYNYCILGSLFISINSLCLWQGRDRCWDKSMPSKLMHGKKFCSYTLLHLYFFIAEPNKMVHLLTVLTNVHMIHFNVHAKRCRHIHAIAFQTQLNAILLSFLQFIQCTQLLSSVKHPNCTIYPH